MQATEIRGVKVLEDKEHRLRLVYAPLPYDDLLYLSINAIREYGQQDLTIVIKLLTLLRTVLHNDREGKHTDTVMILLHDLTQGFPNNFKNESNRRLLHARVSARARGVRHSPPKRDHPGLA